MLQKCKLKLNLPSPTYKRSPSWCVQPSIFTLLYVIKLNSYLLCVCLTVSRKSSPLSPTLPTSTLILWHAYISRNLCMEKIMQIINPSKIRQAIIQKYSRITKSNVMYVSEENDSDKCLFVFRLGYHGNTNGTIDWSRHG